MQLPKLQNRALVCKVSYEFFRSTLHIANGTLLIRLLDSSKARIGCSQALNTWKSRLLLNRQEQVRNSSFGGTKPRLILSLYARPRFYYVAVCPCQSDSEENISCSPLVRVTKNLQHITEARENVDGSFLRKALKHGLGGSDERFFQQKERTEDRPCKVVYVDVNLKFVHFPVTAEKSYLRLLFDHARSFLLDRGNGSGISGGNGNGKGVSRHGGGSPDGPDSSFYLVWGLCVGIPWILLWTFAVRHGIPELRPSSLGKCAASMLWLGLIWCSIIFVFWSTRIPVQVLCKYSPELTGKIPLISHYNRLRLHESMARNFGFMPALTLSWFFLSDLKALKAEILQVLCSHGMMFENLVPLRFKRHPVEKSSTDGQRRRRIGGSSRRRK